MRVPLSIRFGIGFTVGLASLAPTPAAAFVPPSIPAAFPQKVLSNGRVTLTVVLPDAHKGYYRGPRFDWSGMVVRATYKGHSFFDDWKPDHQPARFEDTTGPAEEYGSPLPLGYTEAKPGEVFVKIGVGQLEKGSEPAYQFWKAYKIVRPGAWQVASGRTWIEFRQKLSGPRGLVYVYTKRIELRDDPPGFAIVHTLENTGNRTLITNQYCHNFLHIDGEPIGPSYRVRLPFVPRSRQGKQLQGPIEVQGKEIRFRRPLRAGEQFYGEFTGAGAKPTDHDITVVNRKAGAGVEIHSTLPLAEFHLWGVHTTISPEPFIELKIAPGQGVHWTTRYRFFTLDRVPAHRSGAGTHGTTSR